MKKPYRFSWVCFGLFCFSPLLGATEFTEEQADLIYHWLAHTNETPIHQMRGASGNQVYLHTNGHYEAVYDKDGKLVKDGINDGSYNYAHPFEEPLKHFNRDLLPWILWGSTPNDPTSLEERLDAYSYALGSGLGVASAAAREKKSTERAATEDEVIKLFVDVITVGQVADVYKILSTPGYVPDEPFKIGEGLTKGLNEVIKSGKYKPVKPE